MVISKRKPRKLFSIKHLREPYLPFISMADVGLQENDLLLLLAITFSTDLKWKDDS